jgi:hypothetical protein
LQYGFEIEGRLADDLEHFRRRGLLFQRLARLGHQPRVLHRDHRLGGEALQQRDFFLREGPHLLTIDDKRSEQDFVSSQCDEYAGARSTKIHKCLP